MTKFSKLLISALSAVAIFVGIISIFATASVIESFQLYPHDAAGGFALYLIEVVITFIAATVGGLLCLHRLWFGRWVPGEKHH